MSGVLVNNGAPMLIVYVYDYHYVLSMLTFNNIILISTFVGNLCNVARHKYVQRFFLFYEISKVKTICILPDRRLSLTRPTSRERIVDIFNSETTCLYTRLDNN